MPLPFLCRDIAMNLDKSKKRIAKKVKMGFQGYPVIAIAYSPESGGVADEVIVTFVAEAEAEAMVERFRSKTDAREDEVIQSAIVKMIERSKAKTVEVS
ncbi:MAG: hypothetical protein ACI8PP_001653 [Candidatus Pseudothioglobus sp.]|jgi:hypothetical protein